MSLWLAFAGMALVTYGLWAPELVVQKEVLVLSLENERLLAGAVAIAVAWRWRLTFVTIISGLAALHFFDWLL